MQRARLSQALLAAAGHPLPLQPWQRAALRPPARGRRAAPARAVTARPAGPTLQARRQPPGCAACACCRRGGFAAARGVPCPPQHPGRPPRPPEHARCRQDAGDHFSVEGLGALTSVNHWMVASGCTHVRPDLQRPEHRACMDEHHLRQCWGGATAGCSSYASARVGHGSLQQGRSPCNGLIQGVQALVVLASFSSTAALACAGAAACLHDSAGVPFATTLLLLFISMACGCPAPHLRSMCLVTACFSPARRILHAYYRRAQTGCCACS